MLYDINFKDSFICGVGQCVNLDGGFECQCPQGYMLKSDGRGCIDMRKEMCYMNFSEGVCSKPMTTPQVQCLAKKLLILPISLKKWPFLSEVFEM